MPRFYEIGAIASVRGLYQYQADMRRIQASTETTMNRITNSMRNVNRNAFTNIGNSIANVSNQLRFIGAQIAQIGYSWSFLFSLPIAAGFAAATRAGMEFERELQTIADLGGLGPELARQWGLAVRDLASELGALPTEGLDALYPVTSVGLREAPKFVRDLNGELQGLNETSKAWLLTLKASAVGMGEYNEIAKIATAINRVYGDEVGGLDTLFAQVFVAVREAGGEVDEFAGNLGRALSPVQLMGGSLADLLTFVSVYTKADVPVTTAVTALGTAVSALIDPSEKALKSLNKFGLGVESLKKIIADKGLIVALKSLYDTLGFEEFVKIFDLRAERGLLEVLNADDLLEDYQEIINANAELEEAFVNMTTTGAFQFDRLKSAIQGLGIDLYYGFRGPVGEVISDLTDRIKAFSDIIRENPGFTKLLIQFGLLVAAIGPATVAVGVFMRTIGTLGLTLSIPLRVIGSLISSLTRFAGTVLSLALRTVVPAFRLMTLGFFNLFRLIGGGAKILSTALFGLARGFVFLGGVFTTFISLIGRGALAIRALVSGLFVMTTAMKSVVIGVFGALSAISTLSTIAAGVGTALVAIFGALSGAATAIVGFFGAIVSGGATVIAPIAAIGLAIAALIVGVTKASRAIGQKFGQIRNTVTGEAERIGPELRSHGKNIIEQFGQGMIQGIGAVIDALSYIAQVISYWLSPGSPPRILPKIDEWGRDTAKAWMEGWTTFDYSAITDIVSQFQEYLLSFATTDQQELDALYQVQNFSEVIQEAINQINTVGSLTTGIWANVEAAMSGASAAMLEYVRLTLEVASALEEVEAIQDAIDAATEAYEASIAPLNDRLDEINAIQQQAQDENEIARLMALINSPRVPDEIKELAQLQIEEILINQQLDQAESEYQDIVDPLEDQLAAAEANLAMLEEQLALAEAQLDLEISQNDLLQRIADTLERMESAGKKPGKPEVGEGIGESLEPIIPELPQIDPLFDPDDLPNFEEMTGEIDKQLEEIKKKLQRLKREWLIVWVKIKYRTLALVKDIKESWTELTEHPIVTWLKETLGGALKETVENFDNARFANKRFRDSLGGDGPSGIGGFAGAWIFAFVEGLASMVTNFGTVLGTLSADLENLFTSTSLGEIVSNLGSFVGNLLLLSSATIIEGPLESIASFFEKLDELFGGGEPTWMGSIGEFFRGIADAVEEFISNPIDWGEVLWGPLADLFGGPGDSDGGSGGGGNALVAMGLSVSNLHLTISALIPLINEKFESFRSKVEEVRGNVQSALYQLTIEWVKFKYKTRANIKEVIDKVKEFWDETKEKGQNIIDKLGEIWELGVKVLKEKFDEWLDPIFTKLDEFQTKAEEVWGAMDTAINNAITAVDTAINNFFSWLTNVVSALGELWTIVSTFLQNLGNNRSVGVDFKQESTTTVDINDGSLDLNSGDERSTTGRYSVGAQISGLIDSLDPLVTQIEHLVVALEHQFISDKLIMAHQSQMQQQPLEVTIGPNHINNDMDMVMFEARVRKTVGKMIR